MKESLGRVSGQNVSVVAQFPFLTIVQTYFLQPASGSKVQGERWAPGSNFATVSLPHCLQTSCFTASTLLALAAFWLLPCMVPFGCLIPASFPASLLALCLQSAGADTVGQFYHLPLSPISTVVAIFINHLPWFPMMTIKLSHILSL